MSLKKVFIWFLCLLAAVLVFWSFMRDAIARSVLERILKKTLGITVTISDIDTSFSWSNVRIKGLTVLNPPGFAKEELAYFPRIEFYFSPSEFIFKRKVHFYYLGIWLERFNVIKKEDGVLNLKGMGSSRQYQHVAKARPSRGRLTVNLLQLAMQDVYYLEYSSGKTHPEITRYNINSTYAFENIDTFKDISDLICMYALTETKLFKVLNITLGTFTEGLKDVVVVSGRTVTDTVKGVMKAPFTILKQ